MNWQSLNTIWKPDTFFVNGKKSKMHKITVPNKFLRITPDGHVSYSQRLTIHARCRMHLLKFPLDSQICPLWISSYGYASRYVLQAMTEAAFFAIGRSRTIGYGKIRPLADYRSRSRLLIFFGFNNPFVNVCI